MQDRITQLKSNDNLLTGFLELTLNSWEQSKSATVVQQDCKNAYEFYKKIPQLIEKFEKVTLEFEQMRQKFDSLGFEFEINTQKFEKDPSERELTVSFLYEVGLSQFTVTTKAITPNQKQRFSLMQQMTLHEKPESGKCHVIPWVRSHLLNLTESGLLTFPSNRATTNMLDQLISDIEAKCARYNVKVSKKFDATIVKLVQVPTLTSHPIKKRKRSVSELYPVHVMVNYRAKSLKFSRYKIRNNMAYDSRGYALLYTLNYTFKAEHTKFFERLESRMGATEGIALTPQNLIAIDKIILKEFIANYDQPLIEYFSIGEDNEIMYDDHK